MNISERGIDFIKAQEKLRLTAEKNDAGIWTLGYGHAESVREGDSVTPEQAEVLLVSDLNKCAELLRQKVEVPVTQDQFDALCSILHSVGAGQQGVKAGLIELKSGQPSTLLMFLNQGCYAAAAEQFGSWIYAGNGVVKTLITRREREKNLFLRHK
ncbi:lysozyme [Erwinia persicina]|uniref:Lysozyme n=2 Tax=Erwinia TaxID=551 RepID=A0ABV4E6G2_9GAMM|nr:MULTISPECIES: lysozyme [Erwinia]MCP1438929.1 lysozyme [Erwinia persicina]MDN4626938.1 lysozyme [Erwinia sp. PsM31]MDN8542720.1 lysozyme [Erwinia sp. BC051422]